LFKDKEIKFFNIMDGDDWGAEKEREKQVFPALSSLQMERKRKITKTCFISSITFHLGS
jgi:hypothetical protein